VVQIWPGLIFLKTLIAKHLLAHVSLQRTHLRSQHIFFQRSGSILMPFQKRLVVGGLFTHKSVSVIFEPPCKMEYSGVLCSIVFHFNLILN
jgi:hypothetical protein